MIDRDDIVNDDSGNVDAVATLEQEHEDIAIGYHPDTFEEIGGFYGAYIGADISDDLAPYISCLLYTSPSPRDRTRSRMPSSA